MFAIYSYAKEGDLMITGKPNKLKINHDDYHAKYIGKSKKRKQFFLTTPFEPAIGGSKGNEFIALFIFDRKGHIEDSTIDEFGPRGSFDEALRKKRFIEILNSLGKVKYCNIEVKPFEVKKFNTRFGLIACEPEEEDDVWAVELLPGNYMAFFEPWDSGEYDT